MRRPPQVPCPFPSPKIINEQKRHGMESASTRRPFSCPRSIDRFRIYPSIHPFVRSNRPAALEAQARLGDRPAFLCSCFFTLFVCPLPNAYTHKSAFVSFLVCRVPPHSGSQRRPANLERVQLCPILSARLERTARLLGDLIIPDRSVFSVLQPCIRCSPDN